MAKISLANILSGFSLTKINENFQKIADELNERVLYRDNPSGESNTLKADIDANGHQVYNLPAPTSDGAAARLKDVKNAIAGLSGQTANLVAFEPTSKILANNVQGAVVEVEDHLREGFVSVKRFGAKGDGVTDDTAAIQAAIDALDVVYIPPGNYRITNLKINKNNFTMYGCGYNRSILTTLDGPYIGIEVASSTSATSIYLHSFRLSGNATNVGGIKLGSSDANYCAGPILENLHVWDFNNVNSGSYGVQLACVQNVTIHNCFIYRNRHGINRPAGMGYATSTKISGKTGYLGEGYIGLYVDGQIDDLYVDDVVIEGNANSGIFVTANAVGLQRGSNIYINGAYFEANNASGAGVVYVTGGSAQYQQHVITLDRCNFAINTGTYLKFDKVIASVSNSKIIPSTVSTTATCTVHFYNNRYPNGGDYAATYKALLGNISVRDSNEPYDDTYPNQVNMVTSLTFPTVARKINDPTTLDDYREGTWTPVLTSDGTPPTFTPIDPIEGTFTKIGNLVFCRAKIRAIMSNAGTGTPRISGFPYAPKYGLEAPTVGLSTLLNNASPNDDYILSGSVLVFNGATYNLTNDGYLVFTIVYQTA